MSVGMLPLLLSLIFPACGKAGAQGVKPPGIVDFNHLVLPKSPNKALAAPVGFTPNPDLTTPRYKVPPDVLFAEIASVAAAEPRTYELDSYPAQFQAAWVVRTPVANFPDVVEAAVRPDGADGSALILYSHSIYGYSDFGVNQARVKSWLAAIEAKLIRITP
ncbi:DUF1499 domain-containing protein [Acidiphilium sp. AL]|uniref:DUF1499 domain-containing protein n=1 Tax=Acidiphilium iwatense TaxID=768198 RepID=A0ABS9DV21_9PROT|nr:MULTISPECIES: DUF1499 domain-containing protein [Acidiphilium]MCF3946583.1 DUF1499 domain-containing protein [Acidiphilium iwatense]MCU4160236.1 DUF1499 domain-containing protein [Acidiphilium sp. AL]